MTYPNISDLPAVPSRQQPTTFSTKTDAFLAALQPWADAVNAAGLYVEVTAAEIGASVSDAADSATASANSATASANSATASANSATASANSATASANSATAAATSENNAAVTLADFEKIYLGQKTADPSTDNEGGALLLGATYYNSTVGELRIWDAVQWRRAVFTVDATGALLNQNNLSDLSNAAEALVNLGISLTAAEINDLPNVAGAKGELTKTFSTGETSIISLSSGAENTPVVAVTKEVPQEGITSDRWSISTFGSTFSRYDEAKAVGITIDNVAKTATLASGTWSDDDLGKTISGGGGEGSIVSYEGAVAYFYEINTFEETSIVSGSWSLYGLSYGEDGLTVSRGQTGEVSTLRKTNLNTTLGYVMSQEATGVGHTSGYIDPSDYTKYYLIGGGTVRRVVLTDPRRISSGSSPTVVFTPTGISNPQFMCHSKGGEKLYLANTSGVIYQYSLSTPYDPSTASFETSYTLPEGACSGLSMAEDGTKLIVVTASLVRQYNLGSPWDITTAGSVVKSASISPYVASGLSVSPSGHIIYVGDTQSESVRGYLLEDPWDVGSNNTGLEALQNYSFGATSFTGGVVLHPSGEFLYPINSGVLYQLKLPHPYVYQDRNAFIEYQVRNVSMHGTSENPLHVTVDGTKFYVGNANTIYQYDMSIPFDLYSSKYSGISLNISAQVTNLDGIELSSDGLHLYALHNTTTPVLYQYNLTVPFDLTTATYSGKSYSSSFMTRDIVFSPDGTKLALVSSTATTVSVRTLNTPWDLATLSSTENTGSLPSVAQGFDWASDGESYFVYLGSGKIQQHYLSTPWAVNTRNGIETEITNLENGTFDVLRVSDNGKYFFLLSNNGILYRYSLTRANALPGGYKDKLSLAGLGNTFKDVKVSNDGTKAFVLSRDPVGIVTLNLAEPFQLETASLSSETFNFSTQTSTPECFDFGNDGYNLYITDGNRVIYQYDLSVPWDISTAIFSLKSVVVPDSQTFLRGMRFVNSTTLLVSMTRVTGTVSGLFVFDLSTPWDISTISSVPSYQHSDSSLNAFVINSAGTDLTYSSIGTLRGGYLTVPSRPSSINLYDESTRKPDFLSNAHGLDLINDETQIIALDDTTKELVTFSIALKYEDSRAFVYPSDYQVSITTASGQVDTTFWTDLNAVVISEEPSNSSTAYALSFDNKLTFKVFHQANGERSIVRDNSGTYQFNSDATFGNTTWVDAVENTLAGALRESWSVPANVMSKAQVENISDANLPVFGDTLDLAVGISYASGTMPSIESVSVNYDAQTLWKGAVHGTDYEYDYPAANVVRLTSLGDYNLKVKVL